MRRIWGLWILLPVSWLWAQTTPGPELVLDVNAQSDAVAARGWPLLIRAVVISADGTQVNLGLQSGAWTQALSLSVTDPNGASQSWPAQLVQPASANLSLSGINTAEAVWLIAPADTASIAAGTYSLSVTLDTASMAGSGAWSGSAVSSGAAVTLEDEPASLSAEDEATKYLALAAYARLKGNTTGVGSALDTLIAQQPSILEAYKEKGDLLAGAGDYAGALSLYQQTLTNFLAANPNAAEPLTLLARPIDAMYAKIAQQQASTGATVTSVAPGRTDPVVAPDSIVNAYGSGLATGTVVASGSPTTALGGTTVTITDSGGASVA
ncbi:MAG: tetratricopeptide repeat protein, partial [Bryobacteraceae bacterium]